MMELIRQPRRLVATNNGESGITRSEYVSVNVEDMEYSTYLIDL